MVPNELIQECKSCDTITASFLLYENTCIPYCQSTNTSGICTDECQTGYILSNYLGLDDPTNFMCDIRSGTYLYPTLCLKYDTIQNLCLNCK